jgi:hypothetical protein
MGNLTSAAPPRAGPPRNLLAHFRTTLVPSPIPTDGNIFLEKWLEHAIRHIQNKLICPYYCVISGKI